MLIHLPLKFVEFKNDVKVYRLKGTGKAAGQAPAKTIETVVFLSYLLPESTGVLATFQASLHTLVSLCIRTE